MKIAIFSATLDIRNGYGNFTHELCKQLKDKVDFVLFVPRHEAKCRYDYVDYPVEYILPEPILSFKTKKILGYLFLPKIKNIQDFDIIHSIVDFPYCILAARLANKYKKPFLITTHGTYAVAPLMHLPEKYFLTWAYNKANCITAPSQFTKDRIQEFSKTKTTIKVIHNGVNFNRFQKKFDLENLKKEFGKKKILLTVGGLKSRKGHSIVIQALAKVKASYDNFHYFIAGQGNLMEELKQMVKDLDLIENISFLGNLTENELVKYFQFCDIYIHTPINKNWHFEGFGIVYLEASACSKPIIAADSGGIKDAVLENKTGLVVPENNVDKTAESILRLFKDSQLAEMLGKNGFEYAKEHDWSLISKKFLDIYKDLLRDNPSYCNLKFWL
ncbi:MAG: glycosyltransferase family 4 protein [bacterium]